VASASAIVSPSATADATPSMDATLATTLSPAASSSPDVSALASPSAAPSSAATLTASPLGSATGSARVSRTAFPSVTASQTATGTTSALTSASPANSVAIVRLRLVVNITGTASAALLNAPAAGGSTVAGVLAQLVAQTANVSSSSVSLHVPTDGARTMRSRALQGGSTAAVCATPGNASEVLNVGVGVLVPPTLLPTGASEALIAAIAANYTAQLVAQLNAVMLAGASVDAAELIAAVAACTGLAPIIAAGGEAPVIVMPASTAGAWSLSPGLLAGVIIGSVILGLGLLVAAWTTASMRRQRSSAPSDTSAAAAVNKEQLCLRLAASPA
jgi:hypothetical protein